MLKDLILASEIPCDIKPYGLFHLLFTIGGFSLSIYVSKKLRKLNDHQNDLFLLVMGLILIFLELYKQLFYYYKNSNTYDYRIFPFQLCSVPMYLCILAYFLKNTTIKKGIYYFMGTYNLLGGFVSFFEPSGLIHDSLLLTLHAFVWHMLLVFIGLYLIISRRIIVDKKHFKIASIVFLILCIIAFGINCCFYEVSNHTINMFFVGPKNNNLIVFKDIAKATAWYVATIIYIPCVIGGAYLISLIIKKYYKKISL